jgi:protein required for attachment to host cells
MRIKNGEESMAGLKLAPGVWVIVCDGRKALILENAGDEKFPNLKTRETRESNAPRTHDLGADSPGRVHQSADVSRSAVQQTDWHDQAERDFLTGVAKRIGDAAAKHETSAIILIAPPRALGMLREAIPPAVHKMIRSEIAKDYVHLSVQEIEKHLQA